MKRVIFFLLVAAGVTIRVPEIVQPFALGQGIFAYAGRALLGGATIYRDFWDQNPPGIHLTYAVSLFFHDSPATVWFIDLLATLGTTIVVWRLGRTLLRDSAAGNLAALFFLFGTWPAARGPLGGFLDRAVPETFMSFWISVSVLLLVRVRAHVSAWSLLASSLAVGVAVTYKLTALMPLVAFTAWLAFVSRRLPLVEILRRQVLFVVGSMVPPLVVVASLSWHGVLRDAWTAVVQYNGVYIVMGSGGPVAAIELFVREVWRLVNYSPLWFLGACGTIVAVHRAYVGRTEAGLLAAWLCASGLAILVNGGRLYSADFLQAQPALALTGSLPVLALWRCAEWSRRVRLTSRVVLSALIIVFLARSDFVERGWNVLDPDLLRLRGRLEDAQHLERFGGYAKGQESCRGTAPRVHACPSRTIRERADALSKEHGK